MENNNQQKRYYMVRAMDSSKPYFDYFEKKKIIGVGWSEVNFSKYADDIEGLIKAVRKQFYTQTETLERVISRKLNEIRLFMEIKPGDCIIVPYPSAFIIAEVTGTIQYDKDALSLDISNQFPVNYFDKMKKYPRSLLSTALQSRLGAPGMTISDLSKFSDEIEKIRKGNVNYDDEINASQDFQKELLKRIQEGKKTRLSARGQGVEELVKKLFIWSGYDAKILPKNKFPGNNADADIEAIKKDDFSELRILVQVKHHIGKTDRWAVEQIIEALKFPEYQKYDGYVITTADDLEKDAQELAEANDIKIITGNKLSEILFEKLDDMDDETKKTLGISHVPQFLK